MPGIVGGWRLYTHSLQMEQKSLLLTQCLTVYKALSSYKTPQLPAQEADRIGAVLQILQLRKLSFSKVNLQATLRKDEVVG